ncbi:hypothetical protein ATE84_0721 [Aquimarina sp. MAR_2010_214]|uniref:hypothetical protein n=1 Tax=Aquimarina sp. MAR_2010_214 TaxID=1250026 RepID=UPI000CC90046|nr:hypothetical protein [Aquimarina sp. MAR_2010_214]PKV48715.1 hypothetical protein ATE84_0721 [Aquimarina sp. MAR_2010_214]
MKKLMYVVAYVLALGFVACGSDDDIDCAKANVELSEAAVVFSQNIGSTEACNGYKTAIEAVLNNGCSPDDETTKIYKEQLKVLGDCKFGGQTCLNCTNNDVNFGVCRGENGNAFIQEYHEGVLTPRDSGVPFERYVELSDCK